MKGWPGISGGLVAVAQASVLAILASACFTIVADYHPRGEPGTGTQSRGPGDGDPAFPQAPPGAFTLTIGGAPVASESVAVSNGRVAVSPAPDAPGALYFEGATVTLSAAPDAGYAWLEWWGDCSGAAGDVCTLTMNTSKRVGVAFQPDAVSAGDAPEAGSP